MDTEPSDVVTTAYFHPQMPRAMFYVTKSSFCGTETDTPLRQNKSYVT